MARIKIEDLPVLEDLSTKEVRGIFGGAPATEEYRDYTIKDTYVADAQIGLNIYLQGNQYRNAPGLPEDDPFIPKEEPKEDE